MKPVHDVALDCLKQRVGCPSDVTLDDGRIVRVWNIAWGYDLGDPIAHLTTNIDKPVLVPDLPIDFFYSNEIRKIVDVETNAVWFENTDDTRLN